MRKIKHSDMPRQRVFRESFSKAVYKKENLRESVSKTAVVIPVSRDAYSISDVAESACTASELIDYLKYHANDDDPVVLSSDGGYTYGPVKIGRIHTVDVRDDEGDEEDESLSEGKKVGTYTKLSNGYGVRPDYVYHGKDGKDYRIEQDADSSKDGPSTFCKELGLECSTMDEMRQRIAKLGI